MQLKAYNISLLKTDLFLGSGLINPLLPSDRRAWCDRL